MTEAIINENNMNALVREVDNAALATWSEDKKKEFVATFATRAACARYLLLRTSMRIIEKATTRKYISAKHTRNAKLAEHNDLRPCYDGASANPHYFSPVTAGGRPIKELEELADKRAAAILDELPPIRTATQVIMPDIARKMARRDELLEKGKKLFEKYEELSEPISMLSLDQEMTIKQFRKYVEKRSDDRDAVLKELNRIGKEGCELDDTINKALYAGLPGLSKAVISVAQQHVERATMFDQLTRRVEERVLFGDSGEAMELLARFEKDEAEVSEAIKGEFSKAVEALKLAGLRGKKRTK